MNYNIYPNAALFCLYYRLCQISCLVCSRCQLITITVKLLGILRPCIEECISKIDFEGCDGIFGSITFSSVNRTSDTQSRESVIINCGRDIHVVRRRLN